MAERSAKKPKNIECRVTLLDDSEIEVTVDKKAKGADLFDSVCKYLRLTTWDYFGLVYTATETTGLWLNLEKKLKKQFRTQKDLKWNFAFRAKYYPREPALLREEIAKYQLCLQIRLDLTSGALDCPLGVLAEMSSYWLQSEFGDAENDASEVRNYLSSLRPAGQKAEELPEFDKRVIDLYKKRKGTTPEAADAKFLNLASDLPLYGVHFFKGTDKARKNVDIGIGAAGVYEKRQSIETMTHTWRRVKNIEYAKHKFFLKLLKAPPQGDPRLKKVFLFPSEEQTRVMWQSGVDHHVFFRIDGVGGSVDPQPMMKSPQTTKRKKKGGILGSFRKRSKSDVTLRPKPTLVKGASFRRSASFRDTSASTSNAGTPTNEKVTEVKSVDHPTTDKMNETKELSNIEEELSGSKKESVEEKTGSSESEGEEFKDDDFVEDVMDAVKDANSKDSSTLLLTETIPEEDETVHPYEKSDDMVKSPVLETSFDHPQIEVIVETPREAREDYLGEDFTKRFFYEDALTEDRTPEDVSDKIFERDVSQSDELPTPPPEVEMENEEPLFENKMKHSLEEQSKSSDETEHEFDLKNEERFEDKALPIYNYSAKQEDLLVIPEHTEQDDESEADTLTPEDEPPPRRQSEVRFQDEIEVRISPSYNEDDKSSTTSSSSKEAEFYVNKERVTEEGYEEEEEEEEDPFYFEPPEYNKVSTYIVDDEEVQPKESKPYEEISIAVPTIATQTLEKGSSPPRAKNPRSMEKVTSWKQNSFPEKSLTEDDNRTEGLSTTGAELGDDDFLLDEIEEMSQNVSEEFDQQREYEEDLKIEISSDSLSDITDNTDELCSPKIVEQTWLRTLRHDDDIFLELFRKKPQNVKFRQKKGRNRSMVRSQILDVDVQEAVMENSSTPRLPEVYGIPKLSTPRREKLVEQEGSSRRRFIPSWPFEPQSIASRMTNDDLDKEAIKAAIDAQKELIEENRRIEEMDFWLTGETPDSMLSGDLLSMECEMELDGISPREKQSPRIQEDRPKKQNIMKPLSDSPNLSIIGSRSPSASPRLIGAQQIPGVPDFVHSVIHNYLHSTSSETSTVLADVTLSQKSEVSLKYPPSIVKFSGSSETNQKENLPYEPSHIQSHNILLQSFVEDKVFEEIDSVVESEGTVGSDTATGSEIAGSDVVLDSSTPTSSTSSFPGFIHSIFPLRRSSSDRKRGRSKQRRVRNKVAKKKQKSSQRKENVRLASKEHKNHKGNAETSLHIDTPRPTVDNPSLDDAIDNIVLSETDDVHFAGNETPDTVRKVY